MYEYSIPFPYWVSIPLLAEIEGASVKKLRKIYAQCISNDCVPLSEIPLQQQEIYIRQIMLTDLLLDVDLMRLWDGDASIPPYLSKPIQAFFHETEMIRLTCDIQRAFSASREITPRLKRLAVQNEISLRSLYRKRRIFMNQSSLLKLLRDPVLGEDTTDRYPMCCFYARDYIIHRHFCGQRIQNKLFRELQAMPAFPCTQCPYAPSVKNGSHKKGDFIPHATCLRHREFMVTPNRRDTVNTIVKRIPAQETCLAWEGVRSWASKYHYTPARVKPEYINNVWFSDHTELDIIVITKKKKDGTFNTARVWLTGIMDAATNAMVGYALSVNPNSQTIAEAFVRAAVFKVDSPFYGLPEIFYIDNGKDYSSRLIEGNKRKKDDHLLLNKEFGESGMLEWLGIQVIHALPYRGCSKTIERIWRTIESEWISDLPGYCGSSSSKRPITLKEDLKNGNLYTLEQFVDYFADVIYPKYNAFSVTHESPYTLYAKLPRANTLTPTWRTMAVLKYRSEERLVHQDGIHFDNKQYWCAVLAQFRNQSVRVFAFDAPFNSTISIVLGKVSLGEAHLTKNLHLIERLRYKVIQHVTEQRNQYKAISQHIKEVHSLILQTDILKMGLDIPVIDNVTYGPSVDTLRDSESATDLAIPNEIIEKVAKYIEQTNVIDEPGMASRFFRQLAKTPSMTEKEGK